MVKLSNGKPTKRACRVECHLKSLATKATTKCQVEHIHGNEYRLQYTPTIRGRHELIVSVTGQEVAGSPFPVLVSIHPTQLGKPLQVITGLIQPYDIAVNTAGEVFVAQLYNKNIVIFDKNGKKLPDLTCHDMASLILVVWLWTILMAPYILVRVTESSS